MKINKLTSYLLNLLCHTKVLHLIDEFDINKI